MIIGLAFVFVRWYIKGHFGKWAILFWLNTILAISMFLNHKQNKPEYDSRTGAEVWEEKMRNY